ncbi:hypothetical protein ACIP2X_31110 [Streptomyces sp. NPDC089424]|uniref:hypothetical protein n=1 Tax=Streptomyces sp. NPDC089424 TaxID=3365917 RepID=UPI0037F30D4D
MRVLSRMVAAGSAHTMGAPGESETVPVHAVACEAPGHAVEDFAYPGADKIQQERGFVLERGDGHIVLADCGPAGLLEVPAVHAIKGNSYQTVVTAK